MVVSFASCWRGAPIRAPGRGLGPGGPCPADMGFPAPTLSRTKPSHTARSLPVGTEARNWARGPGVASLPAPDPVVTLQVHSGPRDRLSRLDTWRTCCVSPAHTGLAQAGVTWTCVFPPSLDVSPLEAGDHCVPRWPCALSAGPLSVWNHAPAVCATPPCPHLHPRPPCIRLRQSPMARAPQPAGVRAGLSERVSWASPFCARSAPGGRATFASARGPWALGAAQP